MLPVEEFFVKIFISLDERRQKRCSEVIFLYAKSLFASSEHRTALAPPDPNASRLYKPVNCSRKTSQSSKAQSFNYFLSCTKREVWQSQQISNTARCMTIF